MSTGSSLTKESVALEDVSRSFATSNVQQEDFGSYALCVDDIRTCVEARPLGAKNIT
jgi:hypothetical protein